MSTCDRRNAGHQRHLVNKSANLYLMNDFGSNESKYSNKIFLEIWKLVIQPQRTDQTIRILNHFKLAKINDVEKCRPVPHSNLYLKWAISKISPEISSNWLCYLVIPSDMSSMTDNFWILNNFWGCRIDAVTLTTLSDHCNVVVDSVHLS